MRVGSGEKEAGAEYCQRGGHVVLVGFRLA